MPEWRAYPSRITTEINSLPDPFIEGPESIGSTADTKAATQNSTNSMMALLKGIAAGLNVPDGSGTGAINTSAKIYADPLTTLGEMSDASAPDATGARSAISLMKGILATAGL